MTVVYSITEKGRANLGSFGGHMDRLMKELAVKGPRTLDQLTSVVKRHSDSNNPVTIASWYLSQAHTMSYLKREVKEESK